MLTQPQTQLTESLSNSFDPSLYLVINPEQCRYIKPVDLAVQAVDGGVSTVQIRSKSMSDLEYQTIAKDICSALYPKQVPVFINDRVGLVAPSNAQGVHIGQDDGSVSATRQTLGPHIHIGLTVRSIEEAEKAPLDYLSYVSIGGVFATHSKLNPDPPIGLQNLAAIVDLLRSRGANCPIIAISGIHLNNLDSVLETGVDGVAVVSAICESQEPETVAQQFRKIIDQFKPGGH